MFHERGPIQDTNQLTTAHHGKISSSRISKQATSTAEAAAIVAVVVVLVAVVAKVEV